MLEKEKHKVNKGVFIPEMRKKKIANDRNLSMIPKGKRTRNVSIFDRLWNKKVRDISYELFLIMSGQVNEFPSQIVNLKLSRI